MKIKKSETRKKIVMKIDLYDRVKLKSGYEASVVKILENTRVYICDIDKEDDTYTEFVNRDDIEKVIK